MTIEFVQGNLLHDPAEALVNTVNEVGVMGKGIALQFREAFPDSAREYFDAAKHGRVKVGQVLVTHNPSLLGPRWVIHFPTKRHWRNPSQLGWIREGLASLVRVIEEEGIRSIAMPPLGCGNGGLAWDKVKKEIEDALGQVPELRVTVYEPTQQYYNAPKRSGTEELTVARALVAELIRRYEFLGITPTVLEVQKLAWFLARTLGVHKLDAGLNFDFEANAYGPYTDRLRHLLEAMDGSYLHSEKRLADARPLDVLWFSPERTKDVEEYLSSEDALPYAQALGDAITIIEGFESPLGMELLATVDWLIHERRVEPSLPAVRAAIAAWPTGSRAGGRKQRLFDDRMIELAIDRLSSTLYHPIEAS